MPRIRIGPEPPDKVFNLATPNDLYQKLLWELQNLNSAPQERDFWQHAAAPYHAFNFAITASHLIDWVYETTDKQSKEQLSKALRNASVDSRGKFRKAIEDQYRSIHICAQIANGSKHYETAKHKDNDPDIGVSVEWGFAEPANNNKDNATTLLKIRDGDSSRLATEIFSEAVKAWDHLLRVWGYLEDRFVESCDEF